jgi:hypothetical protein
MTTIRYLHINTNIASLMKGQHFIEESVCMVDIKLYRRLRKKLMLKDYTIEQLVDECKTLMNAHVVN